MTNLKLAIIVPCFNDPEGLRRTVRSVEIAGVSCYHCFIYDDGSSPECAARYCEVIRDKESRFSLIRLPRGNASSNRNRALSDLAERYDAFVWMDCGDEFGEGYLERLEESFLELSSAEREAIVFLPRVLIRSGLDNIETRSPEDLGGGRAALLRLLTFKSPVTLHQGGMISRGALLAALARYSTLYPGTQQNGPDFMALARLISAGARVKLFSGVTCIKNEVVSTTEIGAVSIPKLVARYPDFEEGMRLHQAIYFEHFVDKRFISNSLSTHFYRRGVALLGTDDLLAKRAFEKSRQHGRWGRSLARLWAKCLDSKEVCNLFDNFSEGPEKFFCLGYAGSSVFFNKEVSLLSRLLISNSYESEQVGMAVKVCKDHNIDTVIDVGAANGLYTMVLAGIGSVRCVYAFEPAPDAWQLLNMSREASPYRDKIVCHNCALGDRDENSMMLISDAFSDANRLQSPRTDLASDGFLGVDRTALGDEVTYNRQVSVKLRPLDSVLSGLGGRVFLKVDAEGSEVPIILGGEKFLTGNDCVLQIEESCFSADLFDVLTGLNFQHIRRIGRDCFFKNF